jgi:FecR protein
MLRPRELGLVFFCAIALLPLRAQKVVSARAGLITYLQGPVFIDGKRVTIQRARFPQMRDGETLSTGGSRAELLLSPGVVLRLAENSILRMENADLSNTRVTLQQGQALIEVVQLTEDNRIQIAVGETTIEPIRPGLYRIEISQNATQSSPAQTALRVFGGEAMVRSGVNNADAKRGTAVNLNAGLAVSRFDRKQTDPLHAWAARRSFDLFMSDPEAREKQNHWQSAGSGYVENKNFGVVFRAFVRRRLPPSAIGPAIPPAEHP